MRSSATRAASRCSKWMIQNPVVTTNQWNHVAFTANLTTGIGILYYNGLPVMTNTTPTPITCQSFENVNLGYMNATATGEPLAGRVFLAWLDEVSIYNRPLSDSEINAIYNLGANRMANV